MKAAILGGGMIGSGWARLLRSKEHEVLVHDERPERSEATLVEAVADADLVIEAVAEAESCKRAVLTEAASLTPETALIASSSSSILPSRLQEGVRHPERVLVLHPLHPVDLIPAVEIVPGRQTSPEAVRRAEVLLRTLGKVPVVLKREVPGYVINRLVAALWREAIDLVLQDVVEPDALDRAAARGPCLGWAVQGPFLTFQLAAPGGIGPFMAHLLPAFEAIWRDLARWEQLDGERVAALVAGVREAYESEDRARLETERDRLLSLLARHLPPQ